MATLTLGEKIRKIRTYRGMTQGQLGEMIGADGAEIRKFENGQRVPKSSTIERIADALDIESNALFSDPEYDKAIHTLFSLLESYDAVINKDGSLNISAFLDDIEAYKAAQKAGEDMDIWRVTFLT